MVIHETYYQNPKVTSIVIERPNFISNPQQVEGWLGINFERRGSFSIFEDRKVIKDKKIDYGQLPIELQEKMISLCKDIESWLDTHCHYPNTTPDQSTTDPDSNEYISARVTEDEPF